MRYGTQTATNEQTTLFSCAEQTAKPKCSSIPVFKVTLVREGKMPWGETRMRNSQMVSALLHKYLDGVDREHLCMVLLNQKNEITGISTISIGSLTASPGIRRCWRAIPVPVNGGSKGSYAIISWSNGGLHMVKQ